MRGRRARAGAILAALCVVLALAPRPSISTAAPVPLAVHVAGNQLVDGAGNPVILRGVDRSGSEYACLGGHTFDGPADQASVAAIASWGINAVRIPLNEDCWLGINGVVEARSAYQGDIANYVATLNASGLYAVLDLHWSAPGALKATGQEPMADADHSPAFWSSVAGAFGSNPAVLFDLYNEPDPVPYSGAYPGGFGAWQQADFACLRDGCTAMATQGAPYRTAGMQQLVDAVRAVSYARNVLLVGGTQAAATITQYLGDADSAGSYLPRDPAGQLAVSVHSYAGDACASVACWDGTYAPVAARYPVVATEVGDTNGQPANLGAFLPWADAHGVGYLAWTWDAWNSPQALISDYAGTPTQPYGAAYRAHLAALAPSPSPAASATSTATASVTASYSPSASPTPSPTSSPTASPSDTASATATPTSPASATPPPAPQATPGLRLDCSGPVSLADGQRVYLCVQI